MATLHPLECFLLELYTSPAHYAITRDAIIKWIDAHESAYARLQNNLDPRQRREPLWRQGDVVWGTTVLPNIRCSREKYIQAYIRRVNNDPLAYKVGGSMAYHNKGIMELCDDWMTDAERKYIDETCQNASFLEQLLSLSIDGLWSEGNLTYRGAGIFYDLDKLPRHINRYELDTAVRVSNYQDVRQAGIYLPDADFSAARFICPSDSSESIYAYQGTRRSEYIDEKGIRDYSWSELQPVETTWTLIRRIENEFLDVPERGFFPGGKPEELYTWPEREHEFASDYNTRPFTAMSGELTPHAGLWGVTNGSEYRDFRKDEYLPEQNGKAVRWILIRRPDGRGPLTEPIPVGEE